MKILKTIVPSILCVGLAVSCTDDKPAIEDPVSAESKKDHAFTVDKDGKLEFKAEIVYFDYDAASLTKVGMDRLDAIADHMKSHKDLKLAISGHCDERGSPEYNLALGQRRSVSVQKYLETVGISKNRLKSVSFGEEKPAMAGTGEEAWSKNRRAEFAFSTTAKASKNAAAPAKAEVKKVSIKK